MDHFENTELLNESKSAAETSDMVQAETPETPKQRVAGYRFLAVLFAVLGVGGLFLGLIGRKWAAVFPTVFFTGYGTTLSGSLIGFAVDYLKYLATGGMFSAIMHSGAENICITFVNLLLIAGLAVAVLFSVVAFFAALFSRRHARTFSLTSGVLLFLAYIGLFLWSYFMMSQTATLGGIDKLTSGICDVPTAVISAVLLAALAVAAIAQRKTGIVNALLLVASLLVAFLTNYPGTLTVLISPPLVGILHFGTFGFAKFAVLFFMIVIAFEIVFSAIRLFSKRAYAFDCVRFAVLLLAAILTVIGFIATPEIAGRWAIFEGVQLYCTIGFLALSVLALVASIIVTVVARRAENLAKYAETFPEPAEGALAEEAAAPLAADYTAPAGQPALAGETFSELFTAPIPAPAEPETPAEAVPPAQPASPREAPISEFERRMEALARGEQPDYIPMSKSQPMQSPFIPRRDNAANQSRTAGYADQYTYDPFINSLSPQEKNEFGDLFIACKAGKVDGLPIYSIGGNNEEFFHKVFIYLGKFRKDISSELLDKLYLFVSSNM